MIWLLRDFVSRYRWVFVVAAVVAAFPAPKDDIPPGTVLAAVGPILVLLETARGTARTRRTLPTSRLSSTFAVWLEAVFLFPLLLTIMQIPSILFFSDLELGRGFAVLGTTLVGTMGCAAVLYIFFGAIFEHTVDEYGKPQGTIFIAALLFGLCFLTSVIHIARTFPAMSVEVKKGRFFEQSEWQLNTTALLDGYMGLSPVITLVIGAAVILFAVFVSKRLALNALVGRPANGKQKPVQYTIRISNSRWWTVSAMLREAVAAFLVFFVVALAYNIIEDLMSLDPYESIYYGYIDRLLISLFTVSVFMRTTIWYSSLRALKTLPMSANKRMFTTFSLAVLAPVGIPFCFVLIIVLASEGLPSVPGGLATLLGFMAVLLGAGVVYLRFGTTSVGILGILAVVVGVPRILGHLPVLGSGLGATIFAFVLVVELWWFRALVLNFDGVYRRKPLWSKWFSM